MRPTSILIAGLLLASPLSAEPLSRAQAVQRALEANPDVQKALLDLQSLEGLKDEAKADALPELTLAGSWNRYRDPALLNSSSFDSFPPELRDSLKPVPANLYDGSLQLRQTLFSFRLGAAIKGAKLARQLGDEEVRRARQAVALMAVRAYNLHLLSLEKVRVAEKVVRYKERQLETAQNRYAAGVATELEVLRAQVDLANTRTTLLQLQGEQDLSRAALNAVMLKPIDAPVEPSDRLEYRPLDMTLEQVVARAWERRPEAAAIRLEERLYGELVKVARADALPSLDFVGQWGYSVREPGNFLEADYEKWSAGVFLSVPVFDGWRTRGKVAQAKARASKVTQDRIALENSIRLEGQAALDALRVAKSVLEAAELNVKQAQRALDMIQANSQAGAATFLDVLDAQAALTEAESQRIQGLHTHANARAFLRYVMADDLLEDDSAPATAGQP